MLNFLLMRSALCCGVTVVTYLKVPNSRRVRNLVPRAGKGKSPGDEVGRVRTHEKNSGDAVRRLGTIIQSIFCAQSGTSIL